MSSVAQLEAEIMVPRSKWSKSGKENIFKNSPKKIKIDKTMPIAYLDFLYLFLFFLAVKVK